MTGPIMIGHIPNPPPTMGPADLPTGGILVPVPGKDGEGVDIRGTVATWADLPTLTAADVGAAYYVEDERAVYFWRGDAWPPKGGGAFLKGDKGDRGATGRGVTTITAESDALVFAMTDAPSPVRVTVPAITGAAASATEAKDAARAASIAKGEAETASERATAASNSAKDHADQAKTEADRAKDEADRAHEIITDGGGPATADKIGGITLGTDDGQIGTAKPGTVNGWGKVAEAKAAADDAKAKAEAAYTKPDDGVPAGHLSADVQKTLRRAFQYTNNGDTDPSQPPRIWIGFTSDLPPESERHNYAEIFITYDP